MDPDVLFQLWLFNEIDENQILFPKIKLYEDERSIFTNERIKQKIQEMLSKVIVEDTTLGKQLKQAINEYYKSQMVEETLEITQEDFETAALDLEDEYPEQEDFEDAARSFNAWFSRQGNYKKSREGNDSDTARLQYLLLRRYAERLSNKRKSDESFFKTEVSRLVASLNKQVQTRTVSQFEDNYINSAWIEIDEMLSNPCRLVEEFETKFWERVYSKVKQCVVKSYIDELKEKIIREQRVDLSEIKNANSEIDAAEFRKIEEKHKKDLNAEIKRQKRKDNEAYLLRLMQVYKPSDDLISEILNEAYEYVYEGSLGDLILRIMRKHLGRDTYLSKKQLKTVDVDEIYDLSAADNTEEAAIQWEKDASKSDGQSVGQENITPYELYKSGADPQFTRLIDRTLSIVKERAKNPKYGDDFVMIILLRLQNVKAVDIAKELGVDKSTISRRMKALEKILKRTEEG